MLALENVERDMDLRGQLTKQGTAKLVPYLPLTEICGLKPKSAGPLVAADHWLLTTTLYDPMLAYPNVADDKLGVCGVDDGSAIEFPLVN